VEVLSVVIGALNEGFVQTLKLFFVTLLGALPLGLIISFGSMSSFAPLRWLTRAVIWVIRGTPLMLQLIILYYIPGKLMGYSPWGTGEAGRFLAASIAFIINYACYFSEIYRGGIQGVPVGQQEAGLVLGMTRRQIFFKVTLLQMVKRIVPPMSNEVITLVKDTSLAANITVVEMFRAAEQINARVYEPLALYIEVGLIYLMFSTVLTWLQRAGERKLGAYGNQEV